jgi:hypothetical protein
MNIRNVDPLDVSRWGRLATFERNLMKALRFIPQAGEVIGPLYLHDSIVIEVGELSESDVGAAFASARRAGEAHEPIAVSTNIDVKWEK